jgi:hypothetical protein
MSRVCRRPERSDALDIEVAAIQSCFPGGWGRHSDRQILGNDFVIACVDGRV